MQSFPSIHEELSHHYTAVADTCSKIGQTYFYMGRITDAKRVMRTVLDLVEAGEAVPQARLQLLLLYGQVLTTEHFLNNTETTSLFEVLLQAEQIADAVHDQQGKADALSLLGQAHYFTTLVTRVSRGESSNGPQDQGYYREAFTYQQQALELRESLQDTRGMSESHFYLGIVYERWQQRDLALEQYGQALQIAEQADLLFEKSEPTRHLAWGAFWRGDLDAALTYALQALCLREAANFRPHLPYDHLLLSDIYQARGDVAQALVHAETAISLAQEMNSTRILARAREQLERLCNA